MKTQSGFTLVELVIVVAIITIILAMVTLNFSRLNDKYTVESNIKGIYTILTRARNDASATNIQQLVILSATQVQTGSDADGNNAIDGAPIIYNFSPKFTINCDNNACANNTVSFDRRGLTTNLLGVVITGFSAGTDPAMDCISIAATRINYGKMTGGNCAHR